MEPQKKLPFDKREYRERMEAIEGLTTEVTQLTKGRLKCVQRLIKFVFSHKRSSCEGDLTFVRTEAPKHGQFSLSNEMFISKRALEYHMNWAKILGLIEVATDCDERGSLRTTMSLCWPKIKELGRDQCATDADQCATDADQCATDALPTKPITNKPKSPTAEGEKSDFDFLRFQLRAIGVNDSSCIESAIQMKATPVEIQQVIDHAKSAEPKPPPGVIFGRIRAIGERPKLIHAPWPSQISEANRLRVADALHEREKLKRRDRLLAESDDTSKFVKTIDDDTVIRELYESPSPELVQVFDSDVDELENEFGEAFDQLPELEQIQLAESLGGFIAQQFRRHPDLIRLNLLEAFRDREKCEARTA